MFERFDEPARRTLFFARYEASQLGSPSIDSEHLLLGLIRESRGRATQLMGSLPLVDIRKELEERRTGREVPKSVEIPFAPGVKRALGYAAEEADRLSQRTIGTEHLLLGLMREENSVGATILARSGMHLDGLRARVAELASAPPSRAEANDTARLQIDQIAKLAIELQTMLSHHQEAAMRVQLLLMDLQALKSLLDHQP